MSPRKSVKDTPVTMLHTPIKKNIKLKEITGLQYAASYAASYSILVDPCTRSVCSSHEYLVSTRLWRHI